MLGEFLVVENPAVQEVLKESNPAYGRESASWKQLSEVHFASLWGILCNKKNASAFEKQIKVLVSADGEAWVVLLPKEFIQALSARLDMDNSTIIEQWFASDEFKWGWSKESVAELFNDILKLAVSAKSSNRSLVYWGRL